MMVDDDDDEEEEEEAEEEEAEEDAVFEEDAEAESCRSCICSFQSSSVFCLMSSLLKTCGLSVIILMNPEIACCLSLSAISSTESTLSGESQLVAIRWPLRKGGRSLLKKIQIC